MTTILSIAFVALAVAFVSYLFSSASDFAEVKNQKGSCTEEDYEIASAIEAKRN